MATWAHFIDHPGRTGVKRVAEIWQQDERPERHPDWDIRDVTHLPGFTDDWVEYPDGRVAPWQLPPDEARPHQVRMLCARCESVITGGFVSDALGQSHAYGSTDRDQTNLLHDAADAQNADEAWRATVASDAGDGRWIRRPHDAEQVRKVASTLRRHRADAQDRLAALIEQVGSAATTDIIQSVVW